jgi:hypothetical protein
VTPALFGDADLEAELRNYSRDVLRRLGPHHLQMSSYSTGRRLRLDERLAFRAGASDPVVAQAMEEVATRWRSPLRLADPRLAPRILAAALSRR